MKPNVWITNADCLDKLGYYIAEIRKSTVSIEVDDATFIEVERMNVEGVKEWLKNR